VVEEHYRPHLAQRIRQMKEEIEQYPGIRNKIMEDLNLFDRDEEYEGTRKKQVV